MYAGHFAPITVIQRRYPDVSPFVFTIGVGFLDIIFGILSYYGFEGFYNNPNSGLLGADISCNYSHSLIGSIILSIFYGIITRSFVPGFLSSFSHFIGDWLIHNEDLPLDPYTNIMIGGTKMWGNFPIFSFYFEAVFCIICGYYSSRDNPTIIANVFILILHLFMYPSGESMPSKISKLAEMDKRKYTFIIVVSSFVIPGIIIGFILNLRKKNNDNKMINIKNK